MEKPLVVDPSNWRACAFPGCEYKVCLPISEHFCFSHSPGNEWVKRWKIDARLAGGRLLTAKEIEQWQKR